MPISDRAKASQKGTQNEDIWDEKFIDLDARTIIDARVAMTDPNAKKIRGAAFSQSDRQKIKSHLKRMADSHIIPFLKSKIRSLETSVEKQHKGVKNRLVSVFGLKTPERGESDGLKSGYKMNKSELELRNLVDTALILQDYDTASSNASLPLKAFKGCKAHRFAASCLEI